MTKKQIKAEIKKLMSELVSATKGIARSTGTPSELLITRRKLSQKICGLRMKLEAMEKIERNQHD